MDSWVDRADEKGRTACSSDEANMGAMEEVSSSGLLRKVKLGSGGSRQMAVETARGVGSTGRGGQGTPELVHDVSP